jgi:2Fe-2S ferredoxin
MPQLVVVDRSGAEAVLDGGAGLSVMEIIRDAGVADVGLCGGVAACATCHVYVESDHPLPPLGEDEDSMLDFSGLRRPNSRLSCQIKFTEDLSGLRVAMAPEA